jgi:hypothetical protein
MYITIRKYHTSKTQEAIDRAQNEFAPKISIMPGFKNYYVMSPEEGVMVSISMFDSEAQAAAASAMAKDWIEENAKDLFSNLEVLAGEMVVSK